MTASVDQPGAAAGPDLGDAAAETPAFAVRLDNFEGPFDLLLSLIAKHKMDITEVSLSKVTDEFIAHVKAAGPTWDLEQTTSFLLVAAGVEVREHQGDGLAHHAAAVDREAVRTAQHQPGVLEVE